MRFASPLFLSLLAGASLAVPTKHHHHQHKRDAEPEPVQTVLVTAYEVVYLTEGQEGPGSTGQSYATTTLSVSPSTQADSTSTSSISTLSTSIVTTSSSSSSVAATSSSSSSSSSITSSSSSSASLSSSSISSSSSSASSSATSSSSSSTGIDGDLSDFVSPSGKFEDGVHDCSSGVPTGNGVISLDWVGLSGWASILNDAGNTVTSCQDGYYCSYACQAGMSKTQWPSEQPSDGQSRGGLICKNGKLYRTNTNTDYLCEWGKQTSNAVSKLDKVVSLCRTDYPGSENMVVPTRLTAGGSKPMSVVDESTYYTWQGKPTSAQYYINNAGIDVQDGCIWGTSSGTVGNWAPVVAGAGYSGGITYLSLIPNPNNQTPPNFSVKIEAADSSSSTVGNCIYADGKYNGQGSDGCTVSVTSGTANFVFY